MPLYDKALGSDELCRCKRNAREIHCCECGSTAIEKRKPLATTNEGLLVFLNKYYCRRCTHKFMDVDRVACDAPLPQLSVKAQRTEDTIVDSLTFEERKKIVFEQLKGVKPKPSSISDEIDEKGK
jgi:late competence protein required for DNA uptake (superfamily II DNA/RNA helicase)